MKNNQETITDIIAEMLGARTEFPFVYLMGEPDTPEVIDPKTKKIIEPRKINIRRVTVKELANRLEAAHRREVDKLNSVIQATVSRSDAEIDRLRREIAEPKRAGNAAAMREALAGLIDGICFHCDMSGDCKGVPCEKMQRAKAALAAPPRNCDLYANHNDAMKAFGVFVVEQGKLGLINPYPGALRWLFAPATEKEGGAK